MTSKLQKARIALAERVLREGLMTGASPTQTGAMTGRFMRRLKQSIASGETDSSVLDRKRAQAGRIQRKAADRQSKLYKQQYANDPQADQKGEVVFNKSFDRFGKAYRQGQGTSSNPDLSKEMAPQNAPNPTDVKRRAQRLKPYK